MKAYGIAVIAANLFTTNDPSKTEKDGMSCELISGASGVINQIEVTADGDMTEGVRSISEIIVYTVTAPEAANLGISSTVSLK